MGFRKEFDRAKDWIVNSLTFKPAGGRQCGLSVFESTIRVLGGLLAAHDLSGETAFISKAEELARTLEPAYDTPLFFPRSEIGEEQPVMGKSEEEEDAEERERASERRKNSPFRPRPRGPSETKKQKKLKKTLKQSSSPELPAPLSGSVAGSQPCSPRSVPSRWS